MERKINEFLLKWKKDILRKPLLIYGTRQIGKTYSIIEFGKNNYKNYVYFNTENYSEVKDLFKKERNAEKIALNLSLLASTPIVKEDTLIILDNVNDLEIVKGVKLFTVEKANYHIIMITSQKTNLLKFKGEELQYKNMFPVDFEEYLMAIEQNQLIEFIKDSYRSNKPMPFHNLAMDYYNDFIISGGFPEVIEATINKKDEREISLIHNKILDVYRSECIKNENLIDIPRSVEVINSIPYQLQKENKKFQYGLMGFGKRAKEYDNCIDFLAANNLIHRSYKVSYVKSPLSSCRESDSFKLYLNDTGLLYSMMHLDKLKFLANDTIKNILYENSIAITLINGGYPLYYYQSQGKAEVSFVVQNRQGLMIPIELIDKNISKSKSLGLFMKKFTVKEAIRVGEDNFALKRGIKYIPIYSIFCMKDNL